MEHGVVHDVENLEKIDRRILRILKTNGFRVQKVSPTEKAVGWSQLFQLNFSVCLSAHLELGESVQWISPFDGTWPGFPGVPTFPAFEFAGRFPHQPACRWPKRQPQPARRP